MAEPDSKLHSAYEKLAQQAARAEVLPGGGLTPREQRDRFLDASVRDPHELRRLLELLEKCIYQGDGTREEEIEAIELCERVLLALPPPPSPRTQRARRKFQIPPRMLGLLRWLPRPLTDLAAWLGSVLDWIARKLDPFLQRLFRLLLRCLKPALITAALVGIGMIFKNASFSAPSFPTWNASIKSTADVTRALNVTWPKPTRNVTWQTVSINLTIDRDEMAPARSPGMDVQTGVDGAYKNAVDPFRPPLGWTHRLHVFNAIDAGYRYRTGSSGQFVSAFDAAAQGQSYRVDVYVRLVAGAAVPIPSPSPGCLVTSVTTNPPIGVRIVTDPNEGLYVIGQRTKRVRLRYDVCAVSAYRRTDPLPETPFSPIAPDLPANVYNDALIVVDAIGDLPQPTFGQTVRRLHAYFAHFVVSPIQAEDVRANEFLTVALARKGVCRHRARSFFVTATAVGIETRLVENRTHSFCEVRLPNGQWRRLEFRFGNEEGPPGQSSRRADGAFVRDASGRWQFPVASGIAIPVVMLFIVLCLLASWRLDVSGHRMTARPTRRRVDQRAARDSNDLRAAVRDLEAAVSIVVGDTPLPADARRRFDRIQEAARDDGPMQTDEMAMYVWDGYYVLRAVERDERG